MFIKIWKAFKHDWALNRLRKQLGIEVCELGIISHLNNGCERCELLFGYLYDDQVRKHLTGE